MFHFVILSSLNVFVFVFIFVHVPYFIFHLGMYFYVYLYLCSTLSQDRASGQLDVRLPRLPAYLKGTGKQLKKHHHQQNIKIDRYLYRCDICFIRLRLTQVFSSLSFEIFHTIYFEIHTFYFPIFQNKINHTKQNTYKCQTKRNHALKKAGVWPHFEKVEL